MKEADEEESKRRLEEISTTSYVNQDEAANEETKGDEVEKII